MSGHKAFLLDFVLDLPPSRRQMFRGILLSENSGACQPTMSSSNSSLQLYSIMSLAATANEFKAASAEIWVGTSRAVCHLFIIFSKEVQDVDQIVLDFGHVLFF